MPRRGVSGGFPIAAVVRLTGLSEHALRAWERRYGAVVPTRSAGGTRRYSADDIARLRLLAASVAAGDPIRDAVARSNGDLAERLARTRPAPSASLEEILHAVSGLEAAELERQLGMQLSLLGLRAFLERIALPLLSEIGARWERGALRPNEEHVASAALRGVLSRARHAPGGAHACSLVLATPAGELHELGILMVSLCAQEHGLGVVYLGCDLPADEIAEAALRVRTRAVGLGIVSLDPHSATGEVRALRRRLPRSIELWLGGAGSARLGAPPTGVRTVLDLAALDTRLALLAEAARAEST